MKIGIIALSLNKHAVPGFYNSQELGMGKALAAAGHTVTVYKLFSRALLPVPKTEQVRAGLTFAQLPARSLGINGFFDKNLLDASVDALICFSDTQLYTRSIAKWCLLNNVQFYPYVGVIKSASTNALKKALMNALTMRLIRFYRRQSSVWGKTPAVCAELSALGVTQTRLVPIGLDTELLRDDYASFDPAALKEAHGFSADAQILLFIGRLVPEKEPLTMIALFARLYERNPKLRLCMIGTGELENEVKAAVADAGIGDAVTLLSRVPNQEIWEFYRMSCCYVNLNRHEIYGMAILEAMYYECPVVAFHAPGPDFLLDGGCCGRLCGSDEDMLSALSDAVLSDLDSSVLESGISTGSGSSSLKSGKSEVSGSSASKAGKPVSSGAPASETVRTVTDAARTRVLSSFLWERCLPKLKGNFGEAL